MKVIDFRVRPNTTEYMNLYTGPGYALLWRRFGIPEPAPVPLEYFSNEARRQSIEMGVFTGRRSAWARLSNDYVRETAAGTGGLLFTAYGIDPHSTEREAELAAAAADSRNIGIALDPPGDPLAAQPLGWDDDTVMFPIFEFAAANKLVAILTVGPFVGQFYGNPGPFERIARTFPDLRLVIAHGCWPRSEELVATAYRNDNIYLEASIYAFHPGAHVFRDAAGTLISDKVIYASAFPFQPLDAWKKYVSLGWPEDSLRKILSGNARRLIEYAGGPTWK